MCEIFNSWILSPRHKSVITMFEEIRHKMMSRQVDMIKFVETWDSDISPMTRLVLEKNKKIGRKLKVQWNADTGFAVNEGMYRHTVDIQKSECSCRLWQLRGILCQHAICAFYKLGKVAEDYVEHWYKKDTFLATYQYYIQPIPSMQMWTESANPSIEPPGVKPMPGKPKKYRRKDKDEPKKWEKLSKKGAKMSCSICHQVGHNKLVCSLRGQTSTQSRRSNGTTQSSTQVGSQSNTTQAAGTSTTTTQTSRAPSSMCAETSKIRRNTPSVRDRGTVGSGGRGRCGGYGRGRGGRSVGASVTSGASISATAKTLAASVGKKRTRNSGFGLYTDTQTGTSILNPGRPS
uniref:SWIM-type domain-containing protein n=1 Tax=Nicotiana tabacum TaxID=4097 RepID=A0A1S4BTM9_TOBAC|nr:PREDICTED: uncharacterized protein LOC107811749 [Nicotiana tabacum]